jgi:hypothetical protein
LVLGRKPRSPRGWIVLGAVLPDVPNIVFFLYEAGVGSPHKKEGKPLHHRFEHAED